jgi:D-sedoheptulose 7-phosphate isomerase
MPHLHEQLAELADVVEQCQRMIPSLEPLLPVLVQCLSNQKKVLTCGNGGSAADAMHLAEELVGRYRSNRRPLPAICLNADPTVITCISNDWSYDEVFKRQVEAFGTPGDMLVCFSTSGNSPSILAALEKGHEMKLRTVALLGKDGGKAKSLAEFEVIVPSMNTARIQEIHTWILHAMLEEVEAAFTPGG